MTVKVNNAETGVDMEKVFNVPERAILIEEEVINKPKFLNGTGTAQKTKDDDFGVRVCNWTLVVISWLLFVVSFPFSVLFCWKIVLEYERAIVYRWGRFRSVKGPGLCFLLPCIESIQKIDLRTTAVTFEAEMFTRDLVCVLVKIVVNCRVENIILYTMEENAYWRTKLLAKTMLRDIILIRTVIDLIKDRRNISENLCTSLNEATRAWGIKIEGVEIQEARLPESIKNAIATEAISSIEALMTNSITDKN